MALILASASPRRQELMKLITENFTVIVSDADEETDSSFSPEQAVIAIARQKAAAVADKVNSCDTVISADTVVAIDEKVLGKPHSAAQAADMLSALSGKKHTVFTGVSISRGEKNITFAEKTQVEFYKLSEKEIRDYISTGEPFDKAGAYGIQGRGAVLIKGICGDYYNVMGFPVARVKRALENFDIL